MSFMFQNCPQIFSSNKTYNLSYSVIFLSNPCVFHDKDSGSTIKHAREENDFLSFTALKNWAARFLKK